MVVSCSGYGCTNRRQKENGIHFHRFPLKRPDVLKKWLHEIRRKNFTPNQYSYLCSEHFTPSDYLNESRPELDKKLLKDEAVPSVFKFPQHLQKKQKASRPLLQNRQKANDQNNMIHAEIVNEAGEDSSTNTMFYQSETSHQKEDKMVQCNIKTFNKKLYQNKIKILQQRLKRRNSKIKSLKDLILRIKKNVTYSDEVTQMLEENFGGFPLTLLLHEHKSKMLHKKGVRYTNAMKDFAKTLFFYSPKAYKYVRKMFTLPHPSTIRKWLSSTECEPGFLEEVFLFLKQEVSKNSWLQDCSLVHDSMSLRKQLVWEPDKGRYAGNVDFGTGENSELATEALVLMIVSLTRQFKCPIGFFYVNKINSSVLSTLISTAIIKLNEVGIQVWNVTCDGAPSNLQSFKKLGCNFETHSLNTKFTVNNANRSIEVYSIFDTCHMLKLARSSLADKQIIQSNIDILIDGQSDHSYTKNINFTSFITRGKLKIVSPAVSLILKELEKSFQLIVVMQKKLHTNVKTNILMLARKNILNKSNLFFFPNTHPINVELGSPSHEHKLFSALSESYINIRMRHYAKEVNAKEVLKNKSSLRQKLTKLILFQNV
ncbi:unnamed protein product [Macrosiphum euphorbiae]|uniref:THAP-type domain-containing protein n=1 Tax=Macrosiphum euphorbiae TaxID=13131 RepID=A0AAV0Y8Z9_9HEMI|nr:unnamed protein product [Macrosiphum euphorbiae]